MIVAAPARLQTAQHKALPVAKIREPVARKPLNRCRDPLQGPPRSRASFRVSLESYRRAKPAFEIEGALPWLDSRHRRRHRLRSARKGPRRMNSPSHRNPLLRSLWLAGSAMSGPQAATEEAREIQRLDLVPDAHPMMEFRLADDPGCCRSRHDSLRACFAARCDDVSRNRLFRPKLPGHESQNSQMPNQQLRSHNVYCSLSLRCCPTATTTAAEGRTDARHRL